MKSFTGFIIFIMFSVLVFVSILIYDNMGYNNFIEKQHLGLISQNATWQGILPNIPAVFSNIILIVIVIVIIIGIFIGIYEHYS